MEARDEIRSMADARQNPEMMTMAGKIPAFFPAGPRTELIKEVAAGSAGHAEHGLVGFSYVDVESCAGCACLHLSRAGVDASNCLNGRRLSEKYGIILWNRPSQAKLTRFDTTLTGCFERDISRRHRHFK